MIGAIRAFFVGAQLPAALTSLAIGVAVALATHLGAYWFGHSHGYRGGLVAGIAKGTRAENERWVDQAKEMRRAAESRVAQLEANAQQAAKDLERARADVRIEYVEVTKYLPAVASKVRRALPASITDVLNRDTPIREFINGKPVNNAPRFPPGVQAPVDNPPRADDGSGSSELAVAEHINVVHAMYRACKEQIIAIGRALAPVDAVVATDWGGA